MLSDDIIETKVSGGTVYTTPVEPLDVNASFIVCDATGDTALIDPGGEADRLLRIIREKGFRLKWILLTHAHFDHCLGVDGIVKEAMEGGKEPPVVALHPADAVIYENLQMTSGLFGIRVGKREVAINHALSDGQSIQVGELSLLVFHTPGHSPGSCSFLLGKDLLFSGDTLFAMGVGRTDLPGGDYATLMRSIREKLFVLEDHVRVIPGHADFTTIGEEKRYNPYMSRSRE